MNQYRYIATPISAPSLKQIIKNAIERSPDNPIEALETVLFNTLTKILPDQTSPQTPRVTKLYDDIFRLYLARNMESIYTQVFQGLTYENAQSRIQKRSDGGTWVPLTTEDWVPNERVCMEREVRYSRIILSTILSEIPIQIIGFVFLPLGSSSPRKPTETPIHDHAAPCTGATLFQDPKSFSIEDRFQETNTGIVDFAKQRVWCSSFQPVTDLKNGLHPNVIHRVSYHSYQTSATPAFRVHIYGSLAPNRKMDYSFVKRAFTTEDLPIDRTRSLFRYSNFWGGGGAHES